MTDVDCTGLRREDVLVALVEGTTWPLSKTSPPLTTKFTHADAVEFFADPSNLYLVADTLCRQPIRVAFMNWPKLSPTAYDLLHGSGCMARVVDRVRRATFFARRRLIRREPAWAL